MLSLKDHALLNLEISDELRSARRSIESIQGYCLIDDFYWDNLLKCWVLYFFMNLEGLQSENIPEITFWRLAVEPMYPKGNIWIFPDAEFGISCTFPHQEYNSLMPNASWRAGKLCLSTSLGSWGRKKYEREPRESKARLKWHVIRCREWIISAANNTLLERGDPFELPDFPVKLKTKIIFNESTETLSAWEENEMQSGLFEFFYLSDIGNFITRFEGGPKVKYSAQWGRFFEDIPEERGLGLWVRMNRIPVMSPWQIPENFKELDRVCQEQNIDIRPLISKAYKKLKRKSRSLHFIVLGFPIPQKVGEKNSSVHWFAFFLPRLKRPRSGFRSGSEALWLAELGELIAFSKKIQWVQTENWHKDQITNRGKIDKKMQESSILLIGAGAVGSCFIELFARLGCQSITVMDSDVLNVGNLSRHSLTLNDVGNNKAEMLAKKVNSIFPFINCEAERTKIETTIQKDPDYLRKFDIIIDATAEDDVLEFLEGKFSIHRQFFISLSAGYNAERLYCYTFRTSGSDIRFVEHFNQKIEGWIEMDSKAIKDDADIIEGVGCWHPLFPSRIDDIQMLVSAAFKVVEREFMEGTFGKMTVVEKIYDQDGEFSGLNIING